jgi:3',5'-cyclic AMP phosphodiesterase CpdA
LQISDSHVGFDKPANPNALGTLEEAVGRINALPAKPAFMIHTGDISHLSKVSEFDDADRIISQTRLDVHYVPGEHDFLDPTESSTASVTGAAPRAPAGTASTPAAHTLSDLSTWWI